MKNLLKQIGMTLQDFADLLLERPATIRSWFHRHTMIPTQHTAHTIALHQYAQAHYPLNLERVQAELDQQYQMEELRAYYQAQITEIKLALQAAKLGLTKLQKKRTRQIQRWHWGNHLLEFFSPPPPPEDYLHPWLRQVEYYSRQELLIRQRRKNGKVVPNLTRRSLALQQKIVGLEAQLVFWKQQLQASATIGDL